MAASGNMHHMVPNYDLAGRHHHRNPYKDLSHAANNAEINHPKWLDPPKDVRSRAELMQARKRARVPDASYDFDGDGVVGQIDHFIGRCFDGDNDGRLTTAERRQAKTALENGFLDKYMRGIDQTHPRDRSTLKQTRGVIMVDGDATHNKHPPHWNAHKVPNNPTRTHLQQSRRAEARSAGFANGEQIAADLAPVMERHPPDHRTQPRECAVENIRERAEADHQAARVAGGLLPMGTAVNPEREARTLSLDHVHEPIIATRGQLLETRKEAMKRQCEELRMRGDLVNVPMAVQRTQKDAREFEFRRPDPSYEPHTLTKLKDQRKREMIEHNMKNFQYPTQPVYPRFSDNPDVPFWCAGEDPSATAPAHTQPILHSASEPALKVNHVPFAHEARNDNHDLPEAAHDVAAAAGKLTGGEAHFGSNTKKRWTADMLDRGQGRNKPRLFDNIQPVRIGPRDLESLDLTSSMEHIRNSALRKRNEERVKNKFAPRRSRLWSDPSSQMSITMPVTSAVASKAHPITSVDTSMEWQSSQQTRSLDGNVTNMTQMKGGSRFGGATKAHVLTTSDPAMRTAGMQAMERATMREPKHFGSTVPPHQQTSTGIRSGGFERFEWPANANKTQPQPTSRNRSRPDHTALRESRSATQMKETGAPGGSAAPAAPAAQPL